MLNNALMSLDLVEPLNAISLLDGRGVVITFVWKQLPFAALLISGAMASMDRSLMESARGLGAGRLRILIEIVLPQVQATVWVSLILSFVTMLSALSVPMMIIAGSPTMLTVDMAWRVNSYGDYGVANALGFVSFAMSGIAAWFYLRQGLREGGVAEMTLTHWRIPGIVGSTVSALLIGLLAVAVFGPLLNMLIWTVTEAWYFPARLPVRWGFAFWDKVFRPEAGAPCGRWPPVC